MDTKIFLEEAEKIVAELYNNSDEFDDEITPNEVSMDWVCKSIGNFKAKFIIDINPCEISYEVTYDVSDAIWDIKCQKLLEIKKIKR